MTWNRLFETPATPEPGATRQCSRCLKPGNEHQGVLVCPGKWICAGCYRRPLQLRKR